MVSPSKRIQNMLTSPSETVPGASHAVICIGIWYQVWHETLLVPLRTVLTHCLPNHYDTRRGVNPPDNPADCHLLAGGGVPLSVAKAFGSALYVSLLPALAFVPDADARVMVLDVGTLKDGYICKVLLRRAQWIQHATVGTGV
jgi:hypothetical protein